MSNFYRLLGVTPRADDEQIKVAFRTLAKTCHPDLNAGDLRSEQRFRDINHAYAVLRDPAARAAYDSECARERVRARRRWSATVTMSACFALTVSSWLDLTTPLGKGILAFLSALAEDERSRILARANGERAAAKKRGVKFGPKPKLAAHQQREAVRMVREGQSLLRRIWP